ncbi:MAG: hypothetical protein Q3959_06140 [Limosilactobacillus sp.]|uniref:hypothetical protein n=1 Tax=Limosilactobacillus sp. TaxID=2773925 RepID=UPI0027085A2F|nr:hypothetical protein [Limosilactobacillus sp.]
MGYNSKPQPTYKLIKLTIGVCSVTLMALFASQATVVHADDAATNNAAVVADNATSGETDENNATSPAATNT